MMIMMMMTMDQGENAATAPSGPLVVPAHAALHTGMLFRFDHHINHQHCHHHPHHINCHPCHHHPHHINCCPCHHHHHINHPNQHHPHAISTEAKSSVHHEATPVLLYRGGHSPPLPVPCSNQTLAADQ